MAGESILTVDDNPTNLKLTSFLLKSEGFDVRTAVDGHETLKLLESLRPDLILMDVQLPGIDGLEVTRRLKKDSATRSIPVIALTAYAMKGDEEKALDAGCDGYIAKPIDTRTFPTTVRAFFKKNVPKASGKDTAISTILIAEDDPIQQQAIQGRLTEEGYSVKVVSDGTEALETVHREHPDLIVADILMPRMDGFQLCRDIRTSAELGNTHVILTTAGSIQESDEALASLMGATAFVLKTGDCRSLVESIAEASGHLPPKLDFSNADMAPLRRIFVEEGLEQLRTLLHSRIDGLNIKAARRIAHRWAGTGGTLDYRTISNCAFTLVGALDSSTPHIETIEKALEELDRLFREAEQGLDN